MTLGDFPPTFLRVFAVALGLIWGSFLNVVIYRVPRGLSVVRPASRCTSCMTPIKPWQNLPVLGYFLLRGRARCCGAKLSPRYPLVEAIGGVLALGVLETAVLSLPQYTSAAHGGAIFVVELALALGLVAGAFIDLENMYLPDTITIGGAALGLLSAPLRGMSIVDSLIGAAAGFAIVWLAFIVLYSKIRGRAGMGLGDAKLLMLAGAWFGWSGALFVLAAGAIQGTIAAMVTLFRSGKIEEPEAVRREREEIREELAAMSPEDRAEAEKELANDPLADEPDEGFARARIAFGPFLVLATLECLLFGPRLLEVYKGWLGLS